MPGVEHTRWGCCAPVHALYLSLDTRKGIKNVVLVTTTGSFIAAGAAWWSTDTVLAGGLVVNGGEEKAAQFPFCIALRSPGEG